MAEWPWRYRLRSKVVTRDTPHASDHLCLIWNDSIENWMCCRADRTRCAIFWQFYNKVMTEWPWRYRSRSKVIMHDTPSHAGDHLCLIWNKANLRDLIAATGLVILLKFDPNHRFFSPCDLEIWWRTTKNDRAPLPYYIKLRASFQIHEWIQTEVSPETLNSGQNRQFFARVTLKFNGWPLCSFKLCASFHSNQWIQTRFTVWKCPIWVKIDVFLSHVTLKQGSTLSFLAGCPKSHFLGWYRNFLVYWYLKLDNQVVNSTCPKDKLGWIWRADTP